MEAPITNAEYADGLRQLADFLDANPDAPRPFDELYQFVYDREEFLSAAKKLARCGRVKKASSGLSDIDGGTYKVERQFGRVTFSINIPRKMVCRLVSPAVYDCPDSLLEEAAEYRG